MGQKFFGVILWKASKDALFIESLNLRVSWYGVLFSLGFLISCLLGIQLGIKAYRVKDSTISRKSLRNLFEDFSLYSIFFVILGSRLAYVLFYGFPYYVQHPLEVFKVWRGGLSSHGGIIALIIWAMIFCRRKRRLFRYLSFWFILDVVAASCGIAACMIRLGNFINQEILGIPTQQPWGVIFLNPMTAGPVKLVAVHPVQLYEGAGYLLMFVLVFFWAWTSPKIIGRGVIVGAVLASVSLIRFFSEQLKSHQGMVLSSDSFMSIGQLLSLPFLIFGLFLIGRHLLSCRRLK